LIKVFSEHFPKGKSLVSVVLDDLWKSFGETVVLKSVNLTVNRGEFLVILGPSGSGKTTTLKIIAGILKQDRGHIYFDNKIVDDLPPWERNIGFVFQNLALFPHLTVKENIAFGLKARGYDKEAVEKRVSFLIDLLGLNGLKDRFPRELSGGQQQRVAIARALAPFPKLILMDEPFSNLDALLREQLRTEIRRLIKEMGITTIFVTHDQYEALQLADRIAIMIGGTIVQVDEPKNLFQRPKNIEVARFLKLNVVEFNNELKNLVGDNIRDEIRYLVFSPRDVEFSSNEGAVGRVIDKRFVRDYWLIEIELFDGQTINVATREPPKSNKVKVKVNHYTPYK